MRSITSSYFERSVDVEEYSEDKAIISEPLFREICERTNRRSEPATVKIENMYIPVYSERTLPSGMIALPQHITDDLQIEPPVRAHMWIPKNQRRADRLLWQSDL